MTSPATAERPAQVPPSSEVEQLTALLVAGAGAAAVVGFLAGLPGIGFDAANRLSSISGVDGLLQLKPPSFRAPGPVMRQHLSNLRRRAAYLIMAGRRLGTALVWERSQTGSVQRAIEKERGYLKAHLQAVQRRNEAAAAVAAAAQRHGDELGWYAILDHHTSAECRRAHGSNFSADQPPKIGYPGTVHMWCRCKPGPPHDTERRTDDRTTPRELIALARDDHPSSTHPDLKNKPGKTNWVEQRGGLPDFIKRVAKHVQADSGFSESRAIATAVSQCKKWAAGLGDVKPETRAKAAAAIARWEAMKGSKG